MLDFDRIKTYASRNEEAITFGIKYKFEDGKEEKFPLLFLRYDGLIQNGEFDHEDTIRLFAEGFNFKAQRHSKYYNIFDAESIPVSLDDSIEKLFKRTDPKENEKIKAKCKEVCDKSNSPADKILEMIMRAALKDSVKP